VHYEGEVFAWEGGCYQARRDTAKEPPHDDWIALALPGRDAVSPRVRGTFDERVTDYRALDIVAFNKGSFIARHDNPGSCPGDGWQLITSIGKRGERGEPGPRGERGEPGRTGEAGATGPAIVGWRIDSTNYRATPIMSDGGECMAIELRALFEQFQDEAGR